MPSLSVKGRLITGLVSLAGLAAVIGVVGWLSIQGINRTLNNITDVSAPTVETSDDLVMGLWEAVKVAEELSASLHEAEVDAFDAEFAGLMAGYETAEDELRGLVEDAAMVAHLDSSGAAQEELLLREREVFRLRHAYLAADASARQQLDAFDTAGAGLNALLNELAEANEAEMAVAEEQGDRLQASGGSSAEVNDVLGELFERDYPMVRAALTLQRLVIEMQDTAGEYLAANDLADLDGIRGEFDTLYATTAPELDTLDQFAETDADRETLDRLRREFETLYAGAIGDDRLFDAHRTMVEAGDLLATNLSALEDIADTIADDLDQIANVADAVSDAADEEAAASVSQATMIIVALLGIALVAAICMIVMVIRSVTRPINAMTTAMDRLSAGDIEVQVPASGRRDEIGAMAHAVQIFKDNAVDKVRLEREQKEMEQRAEAEKQRAMQTLADRFEEQVGGIVNGVTQQAEDLQTIAAQLTAAVEETETQGRTATNAAGQASSNVQTMASATEELSSAINEVSNRLGGAASQIQATAKGARDAQDRMDELQAAISQIDQVVAAINDVAEQTNLLALNATIEAARAGEAGKGFAVVASEVKGLANSTRQMTDSIAQQLSTVKSASEGALSVSRSIVQEVDALNQSTTAIASSMEQQSAATSEIGRNAQEAATGTEEVSTSMTGVREASSETSRASDEVHQAADNLGQRAGALQAAVNDFLNEVRTAA